MTTDAESGIFSHSKGIMLRSLFFSLSLDLISLILSADLIRHGLSPFLIQYPNQTPISYPDLITQSLTCSYHATIHADTTTSLHSHRHAVTVCLLRSRGHATTICYPCLFLAVFTCLPNGVLMADIPNHYINL